MLKVKLWRIENVILMKIFRQHELIRTMFTPYTAKNNIKICSADYPELEYHCIHLRGTPENDEIIAVYHCANVSQAKEQILKFKIALEEFVEHCTSKNPENTNYTISDIDTYMIGD